MTSPPKKTDPVRDPKDAVQPINWGDFRDHIATADQEGRRRWLYPRKQGGRFFRARTYLSWLLIAVMFIGPFVRIHGNPVLLLNFVERKFVILGQIFWPQDMIISAVTLLIFVTGIIVFTASFGSSALASGLRTDSARTVISRAFMTISP